MDYIKQVTINARLLNVTFDEWEYVKDALGTLATMGDLTKLDVMVERGTANEEDD